MISGISEPLTAILRELMQMESLDTFHLGGGTNLALKYNHRLSIDIDLFSNNVVSSAHIERIRKDILIKYPESKLLCKNRDDGPLCFLTGTLIKNDFRIKIDVIQNLRLLRDPAVTNGIRLIDDLDVEHH